MKTHLLLVTIPLALLVVAGLPAQDSRPAAPPTGLRANAEDALRLGTPVRLFARERPDEWTFAPPSAGASPFTVGADGVLRCTGKPTGYVRTTADWRDFVLTLEWRFPGAPGNSGVLLRMTGEDKVWPRSLEAQLHSGNAGDIWNIGNVPMQPDASRTDGRRTRKAQASSERPPGEWNRYEITLHGGLLRLVVNGVEQNRAGGCEEVAGKVCLQSEGAEIEFRNVVLTPILGRGPAPAPPAGERATSRPTTPPATTTPDKHPPESEADESPGSEGATGSPQALALARKVRDFAGGAAGWAQVETLTLTFNGARRLFWDVAAGKVRVENLTPAGERGNPWTIAVYDVREGRDLLQRSTAPQAPRVSARQMWVNDFYWLLAPLKVLDPGVQLSIEPGRGGDAEAGAGEDLQRLRLRFAPGTGMTPDNEYVLHVEPATGKVVRWDYYRRAGAEPRSWRFEDYTVVGPLRLSLWRPAIGAEGGIRLSGVAVDAKVPADVWTREDRVLDERR